MAYQLKDQNEQPIKYQGKEVFAHDKAGSIKAINRESRTLTIVGSDESTDRDGDIIAVKGWDLSNFLKNPVFLYAHNYSSVPIGSALKVVKRKDPPRLEFVEKFPSEGLYPFADMIFELFNEKILNASSVGFIPKSWELIENKDDPNMPDYMKGRRYLEQELLELSACPVPSNPNALQNSIKFMKSHTADQIALMLSGQTELDLKKDDVISELVGIKGEVQFIDENEIKSFVPGNFPEKDEEFITTKGETEQTKPDPETEKIGAVLSAKNKSRLLDAKKFIEEVLAESEKPEEEGLEGTPAPDPVDLLVVSVDTNFQEALKQLQKVLEEVTYVRSAIFQIYEEVGKLKPKQSDDNASAPAGETLEDVYANLLSQPSNEEEEQGPVQLSEEELATIKELNEKLKKIIFNKEK